MTLLITGLPVVQQGRKGFLIYQNGGQEYRYNLEFLILLKGIKRNKKELGLCQVVLTLVYNFWVLTVTFIHLHLQ